MRALFPVTLLAAALSLSAQISPAQTAGAIEAASKPYTNLPAAFGDSGNILLSSNAQWAAFSSTASGLTPQPIDPRHLQVFLRNLVSGETTQITRDADGLEGNADSVASFISDDGQVLVFESSATNLVTGISGDAFQVYVYDRASNRTTLAGSNTNALPGASSSAVFLTGNGRFVLFSTDADNLANSDTNSTPDLFLLDRQSGQIKLVSANTAGLPAGAGPNNSQAEATEDGRLVAFISGGDFLAGPFKPAPGTGDQFLYLRNMASGTNLLVTKSMVNSGPNPDQPRISRDGRFVAFLQNNPAKPAEILPFVYDVASAALRMITPPAPAGGSANELALSGNGNFLAYEYADQIYVADLLTSSNRLVSAAPDGTPGNGPSGDLSISSDGNTIIFGSTATNLAAGGSESVWQLYRWDRLTGSIALLSRDFAGSGGSDHDIIFPVLSSDGSAAGFMTYARNLTSSEPSKGNNVFVVKTSGTSPATLVSAPQPGVVSATANGSSLLHDGALSANGRILLFTSSADNIVPGDQNGAPDVFIRDLAAGTTRLVSTGPDGIHSIQGGATLSFISQDGPGWGGALSDDGSVVVFSTLGTGPADRAFIVRDSRTGTNRVASILPDGTQAAQIVAGALSADGRWFVFVGGPAGTSVSAYLRDLTAETTVLIEPALSGAFPGISAGGEYLRTGLSGSRILDARTLAALRIPFLSYAQGISADGDILVQLPPAQPSSRALEIYSASNATSSVISTNYSGVSAISADGKVIAYFENASGSTSPRPLFILDRNSGVSAPLAPPEGLQFSSESPLLSADGRFLVIRAGEVSSNTAFNNIYRYDRLLTNFVLVSHSISNTPALLPSSAVSISADARVIAFESYATDLVTNDLNNTADVFIYRSPLIDQNGNGLEDGWEIAAFGQAGADPSADPDGDGASNLQEFQAGTNPVDKNSLLALLPSFTGSLSFQWNGAPGKTYQVQTRAALDSGAWSNLGEPLAGTGRVLNFAPGSGQTAAFYRLAVVP